MYVHHSLWITFGAVERCTISARKPGAGNLGTPGFVSQGGTRTYNRPGCAVFVSQGGQRSCEGGVRSAECRMQSERLNKSNGSDLTQRPQAGRPGNGEKHCGLRSAECGMTTATGNGQRREAGTTRAEKRTAARGLAPRGKGVTAASARKGNGNAAPGSVRDRQGDAWGVPCSGACAGTGRVPRCAQRANQGS